MIQVVADANALIAPFKLKFNIDAELERLLGSYSILVPKPIIGELERLAETSMNAKGALKLALSKDVRPTRKAGDAAVLELARRVKGHVMTNDRELIGKARKAGLAVIRLREGCRLEVVDR
jgi:rRNA-processing protein FCF1